MGCAADEADVRREREVWLFQAEELARRPLTLLHLSSHGLLLQLDVRLAFLAAAWASVIVMAQAVIEATLRNIHLHDYATRAKDLFFGQDDLERIRQPRNELVRPQASGTPSRIWVLPDGGYAGCHAALEKDAEQPDPRSGDADLRGRQLAGCAFEKRLRLARDGAADTEPGLSAPTEAEANYRRRLAPQVVPV